MRTALITGASGAVARALAQRLRGEGWRLILVSRDTTRLDAAADDVLVRSDVSTPGGAEAAFALAAERAGELPEALVNCAGATVIAPFGHVTAQAFRACITASVDTAFFSTQAYTRALLAAGRSGSIVLFGSAAASPAAGQHAAVAAVRGAIESLVRAIAAEYGSRGIRINAIAPGPLLEEASLESSSAEAASAVSEAAAVAAWLLGRDARRIAGEIIHLDTGVTGEPAGAGA